MFSICDLIEICKETDSNLALQSSWYLVALQRSRDLIMISTIF